MPRKEKRRSGKIKGKQKRQGERGNRDTRAWEEELVRGQRGGDLVGRGEVILL